MFRRYGSYGGALSTPVQAKELDFPRSAWLRTTGPLRETVEGHAGEHKAFMNLAKTELSFVSEAIKFAQQATYLGVQHRLKWRLARGRQAKPSLAEFAEFPLRQRRHPRAVVRLDGRLGKLKRLSEHTGSLSFLLEPLIADPGMVVNRPL